MHRLQLESLEDRLLLNIDFPSFENATESINLIGNSFFTDGRLRLSDSGTRQGAAWHVEKQYVSVDFETEFTFQMENSSRGFGFVLQNGPAHSIGSHDPSYNKLPNSLVIEFDPQRNGGNVGDPDNNHISVQSRGEERNSTRHQYSLAYSSRIPNLNDGRVHTARIRYQNEALEVYVDGAARPAIDLSIDLAELLNLDLGRAWIGFVSSNNRHDLLSWSFENLTNHVNNVGIRDAQIVEGNHGSTNMEFVLERNGVDAMTVNWMTIEESATAGSDFQASSGRIEFTNDGTEQQILRVPINGDTDEELFETFTVQLTLASGNAVVVDDRAVGVILNDDTKVSVVGDTAKEGSFEYQFADVFVEQNIYELSNPRGVEFGPDGNLYVTSEAGGYPGAVFRFDAKTGSVIDIFALHQELDGAKDLEFGPDGDLYVTNNLTQKVVRFDGMTGDFKEVFVTEGAGGLNVPRTAVFGPDNNLYVASANTNQILRYEGPFGESPGRFLDVFIDDGVGGLQSPTALVFGPNDTLYVASGAHAIFNNSILRFDSITGEFIGGLDVSGTSTLALVPTGGLLFGPDFSGDGMPELIASNGDGPDEVLMFDGVTGELLRELVPNGSGGLGNPKGLEFDYAQRLYVVDPVTYQVLRYAPKNVAMIKVQLSSPISEPLSIGYTTVDSTAFAGLQYQAQSGEIVIPAGRTEAIIFVPTINNDFDNNNAQFNVVITAPADTMVVNDVAQVTISDQDIEQPIPGDSNLDGVFNSSDLVRVFQRREYEDDVPNNSVFEDGDWNGDGDFTTSDFVFAFRAGTYQATARPESNKFAAAIDLIFATVGNDSRTRRAFVS